MIRREAKTTVVWNLELTPEQDGMLRAIIHNARLGAIQNNLHLVQAFLDDLYSAFPERIDS
jgi:hypothetical protein